jgi:glycosyltransferase involved in cell wall biosynthesis
MKIAIDISQIVYKGTGVARYTEGLVKAILNSNTNNDWSFFYSSFRKKISSQLKSEIKEKGLSIYKLPLPPTALSFIWNRLHIIDLETFTGPLDWFITSDWTEPPTKCVKKATVVHDLAFLRYPETVEWKILKTQQSRFIHVCKESNLIFADSESTKADIINFLNISEKKIKVVYPGVSTYEPSQKEQEKTRFSYKLKKPFILTVGKIEPRKNIKRLIEAFTNAQLSGIDLVVVGQAGWQQLNTKQNNIHFLGHVPDKALFSLYKSALFFIMPSIWEGFGYPLIEAMQLGAATAASNNSSLKEIGSNGAAYLFNPESTADISQAIIKLSTDQQLRKNLSIKGKKAAIKFSWNNSFKQIEEALSAY